VEAVGVLRAEDGFKTDTGAMLDDGFPLSLPLPLLSLLFCSSTSSEFSAASDRFRNETRDALDELSFTTRVAPRLPLLLSDDTTVNKSLCLFV